MWSGVRERSPTCDDPVRLSRTGPSGDWQSVAGKLVLRGLGGVLRLARSVVDSLLGLGRALVRLALRLQLVVAGEVAGGLLGLALVFLGLVGCAHDISNRVVRT